MLSKQATLKPLLESETGVHLTAYLVNRGDLIDLKSQLKKVINDSYWWLNAAMTADERKRFLEPLNSLLLDGRVFKKLTGNIGLFRTFDSFRVLNIPVDVELSCQVATSFHVKPLLRWLQADREFLLLGIEKNFVHLYLGSQDSFKLLDSILLPDICPNESREAKVKEDEAFTWLNKWILDLTKTFKPKLFLAGDISKTNGLRRHLKYTNTMNKSVSSSFGQHNISHICADIRKIIKDESKRALATSVLEFTFADEEDQTCKNIFQIARAAVQGKVRKLIVTDELSIFGKIDRLSGALTIHPFDLDHEDDCVLDDLAQMVLSQGGEVVIAKRDAIPNGRPILAILDDDGDPLDKVLNLSKKDIRGSSAEGRTI